MISFFNGRRRGLGGEKREVYAQVDVDFRDYLFHFKGASLAVFMAISLHGDEEGWSWPSYETLAKETGYSLDTIRSALQTLCELMIDGQRVLLRYQPQADAGGKFASNRYLIFPSAEEVAENEGSGVFHRGSEAGGGFQPSWEKPITVNRGGKNRPDRGGKTPPLTITIEQTPSVDGDVIMAMNDVIDALLERGWNAGEAKAAEFVKTHGEAYTLEICAHASKHKLGAGWIRKNAGTWLPSKGNGAGNGKSSTAEALRKYAGMGTEYEGLIQY